MSAPQTTAPVLLGPDGSPLAPSRSGPRAFRDGPYRGSSRRSFELSGMSAPNLSGRAAARWNRQTLADRARDLVRNESIASTGVRKSTGMGVGSGWTLRARPDAQALGITEDDARDLARQIERVMRRWGTSTGKYCHARRRLDFGGMLRLFWGEWSTVNEAFAVMVQRPNTPRGVLPTAVQDIDTDRLCNPFGAPDSERLLDGVEMDDFGAALAYHIRRAHPSDPRLDLASHQWIRVPRETDYGRPVAIHAFRHDRAEQVRGITPFAPLIEKFVMRAKMERTELQSALLNAVFAAFIETGFDPMAVADMLGVSDYAGQVGNYQSVRAQHYADAPITLNDIQVPILAPGDKITTNTAGRQASSFAQFNTILTQNIAATLGVAEGQVSGNYGGLNYSTLRGAYNEIYAEVGIQRAEFGSQLVKPVYLCVLDDALRTGQIVPPASCADLWDEPDAWSLSEWIGPARGHIDSEKEAKGDALRLASGLTTRTDVAAANGQDFEEIVRTRAEEDAMMREHGLDPSIADAALAPTPVNSRPGTED